MEITLVEPGYEGGNYPPIGLLSVATHLNLAGHKVKIKNYAYKDIAEKNTRKEIENDFKDSDLIGLHTISGPAVSRVIKISEIAKSMEKKVVWGGPHTKDFSFVSLKNDYVDCLVIGEGEKTTPDLADRLEKNKSLRGLKGVWYKEGGRIIENPPAPLLDLNKLPIPNWRLADKSFIRSFRERTSTFIESQRGCVNRCSFCSIFHLLGQIRIRNIPSVIEEIKLIKEVFPKVNYLKFTDCTFTQFRKRSIELMQALKKENLGIEYVCDSRVNVVDLELLKILRKCGMREINFGVESGSPRILKLLNKEFTVPQVIKAFDACHKADMEALAFLIFANPTETYKDIWETLKLCWRIKATYYRIGFLKPFPGTAIYPIAKKHGFKEPKTLEEWCNKVYAEKEITMNLSEVSTAALYLLHYGFLGYTNLQHVSRAIKAGSFKLLIKEVERKASNILFKKKTKIKISG